jgi:hypothetical protein
MRSRSLSALAAAVAAARVTSAAASGLPVFGVDTGFRGPSVLKTFFSAVLALSLLVVPASPGSSADSVVQITSGPSATTTQTSATFEFSVTVRGVAYTTCSLDGGRGSTCSSPASYTGLAAGDHTFVVTAHSPDGGTAGSDSRGWTIVPAAPPPEPEPVPPPVPPSGEATITFEEYPAPKTITGNYRNLGGPDNGVVFQWGPTGSAGPAVYIQKAAGAKSPSQVGVAYETRGEFPWAGVYAWFPNGGKHLVRVHVGAAAGSPTTTVTLTAFDLSGSPIFGLAKSAMIPGDGSYTTMLEVSDPLGRIAYFRVVPGKAAAVPVLAVDDITFDIPKLGDPPATPDFALTFDESSIAGLPISVRAGSTSSLAATVLVNRFGGSTGPLATSVNGLSPGVSAIVTPDNGTSPTKLTLKLKASMSAAVGSGKLTLIATPTPSSGPAARSVTIPYAVVKDYDLALAGMEVTQGVQTFGTADEALPMSVDGAPATYAGVPLVSGKKTIVRVYGVVAAGATQVKNVTVLLHGSVGGKPLPGSPLAGGGVTFAAGNPKAVTANAVKATTTKGRATFVLGPEWTKPGKVDLRAEIVPPTVFFGGAAECSSAGCAKNNSFTLKGVPFTNTGFVVIWPLEFEVKGDPVLPNPAWVYEPTARLAPLSGDGFRFNPDGGFEYRATFDATTLAKAATTWEAGFPTLFELKVDEKFRQAVIMSKLKDFKLGQKCSLLLPRTASCPDIVAGVIGGYVNGLSSGSIFSRAYTVVGTHRPLTSVAHETGHSLGRWHASGGCGGDDNGEKANSWPDAWGFMDGIGLNVETFQPVFKGNAPPRPTDDLPGGASTGDWYDFMSYCGRDYDTWVAARNWKAYLASLATFAKLRTPSAHTRAVAEPVLVVRGFVYEGLVVLTSLRPELGTPTAPGEGEYTVILRDGAGQLLAQAPLAVETLEAHGGASDVFLNGAVPLAGIGKSGLRDTLASVEVVSEGDLVARVRRSANTPAVTFVAPSAGEPVGRGADVVARWRAADRDGDALEATLEYSSDDGRTWSMIWSGPSTGAATVPRGRLLPSDQARFRVEVSDGLNRSTAASQKFVVVERPPSIRIASPERGTRARAGERIPLLAVARDAFRRPLRGRGVTWHDGRREIAVGDRTSAGFLAPGVHHISVVARDGRGRTATASMPLRVLPAPPALIVRHAPARIAPRARALELRLASTLAATVTASGAALARTSVLSVDRSPRQVALALRPGRGHVTVTLRAVAASGTATLTIRIRR